MEIKKVLLVGAGAIGAVCAKQFDEYLPKGDFAILANGARKQRLQEGIFINDEKYLFNIIDSDEKFEPDLIIISTKYPSLNQAIDDITNYVKENTIILSLLNGIESEEIISNAFGSDKVIYGTCNNFPSLRNEKGIYCKRAGFIPVGEKDNQVTERINAVCEILKNSGIRSEVSQDIHRDIWVKFLINLGSNQVSALTGATYQEFADIEQNILLSEMIMLEALEVGKAAGINITKADVDSWVADAKNYKGNGKTSTLQDIEAGRKTEVEFFSGTIVKLGEKLAIKTPVNKFVLLQIQAIEKKKGVF